MVRILGSWLRVACSRKRSIGFQITAPAFQRFSGPPPGHCNFPYASGSSAIAQNQQGYKTARQLWPFHHSLPIFLVYTCHFYWHSQIYPSCSIADVQTLQLDFSCRSKGDGSWHEAMKLFFAVVNVHFPESDCPFRGTAVDGIQNGRRHRS